MKILILKTSSMGDIIHTLPALSDAASIIDGIEFDWVVEEGFAEIPAWHHSVKRVIPIAMRRWRKKPFSGQTLREWSGFKKSLQAVRYDKIIDAQGLLKSACLTLMLRGEKYGYSWCSARESIASLLYDKKFLIKKKQHAVERIRQLFSFSLDYPLPANRGCYGLNRDNFDKIFKATSHQLSMTFEPDRPYIIFLHGTTRHDKHWPEPYWKKLAGIVSRAGYTVLLPWGNEREKKRAEAIEESCDSSRVTTLPRLKLEQLAALIVNAKGVVAIDTGLGHMTAALSVPAVSLYGATDPALIGTYGACQQHLTPEDSKILLSDIKASTEIDPLHFATMTPEFVWQNLQKKL